MAIPNDSTSLAQTVNLSFLYGTDKQNVDHFLFPFHDYQITSDQTQCPLMKNIFQKSLQAGARALLPSALSKTPYPKRYSARLQLRHCYLAYWPFLRHHLLSRTHHVSATPSPLPIYTLIRSPNIQKYRHTATSVHSAAGGKPPKPKRDHPMLIRKTLCSIRLR